VVTFPVLLNLPTGFYLKASACSKVTQKTEGVICQDYPKPGFWLMKAVESPNRESLGVGVGRTLRFILPLVHMTVSKACPSLLSICTAEVRKLTCLPQHTGLLRLSETMLGNILGSEKGCTNRPPLFPTLSRALLES
jgi:hypothetical protein